MTVPDSAPAPLHNQLHTELHLREGRAPIEIRRSKRARRLGLRVDPRRGAVVLVLPVRAKIESGLDFVSQHSGWIERRLGELAPPMPFADGAVIPFLGQPHAVRHAPGKSKPVQIEDGVILVAGKAEHLARRLKDWLKAEAKARFTTKCRPLAETAGRKIDRIVVREMRSRWGSAGTDGRLCFSWRLVLAPEFVLDYLAAHEVAHLAHAHHGPAFWALTRKLYPDFEAARDWLRRHGADLHRYG